jgi:hypothetical protein
MATRRTFQAVLTRPESLDRIRQATGQIERARGRVRIESTTTMGIFTVLLELPDPYTPEMFVPGIPFYEI